MVSAPGGCDNPKHVQQRNSHESHFTCTACRVVLANSLQEGLDTNRGIDDRFLGLPVVVLEEEEALDQLDVEMGPGAEHEVILRGGGLCVV